MFVPSTIRWRLASQFQLLLKIEGPVKSKNVFVKFLKQQGLSYILRVPANCEIFGQYCPAPADFGNFTTFEDLCTSDWPLILDWHPLFQIPSSSPEQD